MGQNLHGMTAPVVLFEDDDIIHEEEHIEFIVRYWEMVKDNKPFLMAYYTHMEKHRLQKQEKQAMLMPGASLLTGQMMQLAGNQPPPNLPQVAMDSQMRKMQQMQADQAQVQPGVSSNKQAGPPGTPPGAPPKEPTAPAKGA
jgi:hypothetical protein